jgi:predicted lipoprotein with Yx(FWY)xxD motif
VLRNPLALTVVALAALLAIAGCGGGDSESGGAYGTDGGAARTAADSTVTEGETGGNVSGGAGVVSVADNPKLGPILVDSKGLTLYDFHKDKGGKSACYGACASTWPPLTVEGAPKAMSGAQASQLGTTKRKDGAVQVTYAGWPLYTYAADSKPGDTNGQDVSSFGAQWYALQPSGEEVPD